MNKSKLTFNSRKLTEILRKITTCLAVLVVFISSYMLVLPAISMDSETANTDPGIVLDENRTEEQDMLTEELVFDEQDLEVEENVLVTEEPAETIDEINEEISHEPVYFYDDSTDVTVMIEAPYGAFPENTTMAVTEVQYRDIEGSVTDVVEDFSFVQAIDITFYHNDEAIEPALPIKVSLVSSAIKEADESMVLHISNEGQTNVVELSEEDTMDDELVFESQEFSTYVIVYTEIEKTFLSADGQTYRITVTYDQRAQIPKDAVLEVEEILYGTPEYDSYLARVEETLEENKRTSFARFFDISILSDGVKIQPADSVNVEIELADTLDDEVLAMHFSEEEELEMLKAEVTEDAEGNMESVVTFTTEGFSVYAIAEVRSYESEETIANLDGNGYYVCIDNNNGRYYFKNTLNGSKIAATNVSDIGSAALYYFEAIEGSENGYHVYTYDQNGTKVYLNMSQTGAFSFAEETMTDFFVEANNSEGSFYIYAYGKNNKKYAWYYNSDGFSGSTNNKSNRNEVYLIKNAGNDPFVLDGKTFGIVNNSNTVSGYALMTGSSDNSTKLKGKNLVVRIDVVGRREIVLVAENSDIAMWSFTSVEKDQYYITTEVNGSLKYLSISDSALKLVDANAVDDSCLITIEEGTGTYSGKYKFSSGSKLMKYSGEKFGVENNKTNNANDNAVWMNFAELSNLHDDDFVVYTAAKVSVSGTLNELGEIAEYDVKDGDQVIIYTRIWNDTTKRYDYYAVDYDGVLVKAYESGDTISWVGSKVNTMLWDFTEYCYEGTETPNGYYEFQNTYSGNYLAPQITQNLTDSAETTTVRGVIQSHPVGVLLKGRESKGYYSTILAWDGGDDFFDYASIRANKEEQVVQEGAFQRASNFYFAIMKAPEETTNELTTVTTIDHSTFGITLKIQDYENINSNNRSQDQVDILGNTSYQQWTGTKNLLSRYLEEDGYPIATASNRSLSELYDEAMTVNQQFLMSTYNETGYFEYDSTQNFAHLITSTDDKWYGKDNGYGGTYKVGDFVVYEQLGTSDEGNKDTLKHGQFFPFNDITDHFDEEGNPVAVAVSKKYKNTMDIHANPLSSLNPRKDEDLYSIPYKMGKTVPDYVDHFYGMEMSASFMQSESGLDAWGHDLIFEFSGDDDFWLYVDDVLVLDLGGIHSALDGKINFRTGEVNENGTVTNLRALYKKAYLVKKPNAEDSEVNEWLNSIFKDDGSNTGTVFKDYSGHTMKMFYMERGAGASNLHMRFNLAPYTDGEVLLEKQVTGSEVVDQKFAYQIFKQDADEARPSLFGSTAEERAKVVDYVTKEDVPYLKTYQPENGLVYSNVFLLDPGQTVSIQLNSENTKYTIRECSVDTSTFDYVKVNNEDAITYNENDDVYKDYIADAVKPDVLDAENRDLTVKVSDRKKVIFENHVDARSLKSVLITKRLWEDVEKTKEIFSGEGADRDNTEFKFRIYVGMGTDKIIETENGTLSLAVYNTGKYYVKDPDGFYCAYIGGQFVPYPVGNPTAKLSTLSNVVPEGELKSDLEKVTFYTSPGGAAEKIRAGYSIEIPELMSGTPYYAEERDYETPVGYNLIGYTVSKGAYAQDNMGEAVNYGVVTYDTDGTVLSVHNQHGYTLVLNKIWSDADFMEDHDEIYFGVYLDGELLEGSIRQLGKISTEIRWFFTELAEGKTLNNYQIYEITLDGDFTVSSSGAVVLGEGCEVRKLIEGDVLQVGGTTNEHGYATAYDYSVSYKREELTEEQIEDGANTRTDTVTNARPGIKLVKTNMDGGPLEGGMFTLVKKDDETIKKTFISGEDGLIAVAYLTAGDEYILTETAAPYKYRKLINSLRIKVGKDNKLYVNDSTVNGVYYTITQVPADEQSADKMPTVSIKNMSFKLKAIKTDAVNGEAIEGITFALYREVIDYNTGKPMPDYSPMIGYEELTTDENGVIPQIDLDHLRTGVYYLREVGTLTTYEGLDFDIRLTISATGEIRIEKAIYSNGEWKISDFTDGSVTNDADKDGNVTINIKNTPAKGVQILKKNYDNEVLSGATFELYKMSQIDTETNRPKENEEPILSKTTGADGIIDLGVLNPSTSYYLYETKAPDGYILLSAPVIITTTQSGKLSASLNNAPLDIETIKVNNTEIIQITVYNSSGYELPSTGGHGVSMYYISGACLVVLSVLLSKKMR